VLLLIICSRYIALIEPKHALGAAPSGCTGLVDYDGTASSLLSTTCNLS
jgi:hypothetical protein